MSSSGGELFIVSAPSGTGKTTLIQKMMESRAVKPDSLAFSVSHTTRPMRDGEVDGEDYHFVSRCEFQRMIDEDLFLESFQVHDHFYGTSKVEVLPRLEDGIDVLLDIDVQGAKRILELPESVLSRSRRHGVLVLPPSYSELRSRLELRGLDSPGSIRRRLGAALAEVQQYQQYDYVIVNDDRALASAALASIILDKRHRTDRMNDLVSAVLADFSQANG